MADLATIAELRALLAKATPGEWACRGFTVEPVNAEGLACPDGCDGGCDDDPRIAKSGGIECARVTHASEVIADFYGLLQFAEADGRAVCALKNAAAELLDAAELLADLRRIAAGATAYAAGMTIGDALHHAEEDLRIRRELRETAAKEG
ncbi:MAG: hypothetical protein HOW73_20210 [Polyangiaceae bacterium]|nr:hypothetical protein [Polyangiaceae bacterium]